MSTHRLIVRLLAFLTALTLLFNLPTWEGIVQYQATALIYLLLTAFALYFGVVLAEGELSSAHVVGMLATLSLPPDADPVILWALALGAVLGSVLLITRTEQPKRTLPRSFRSVIMITARVTLSFFVAGTLFQALTDQPMFSINAATALPIIAFVLTYNVIYFAIFILELNAEGALVQRVLRNSAAELFAILTLPIPFALLGAEVYNRLSIASFIILIAGLALTIFGQYGISRTQHQLRRQLDELRSLSVMSQVVSSSLNLDSLLNMVYVQVSSLLDVSNFVVALQRGDRSLTFPLIMWNGEPVASPEAPYYRGLIAHILATQRPLLLDQRDPRAYQFGIQTSNGLSGSWLGVPLMSGGRLLGVMAVASHIDGRRFDNEDLRVLNIVAANASIAIENAQLFEQQTGRVNQLVTLNHILSLLTGTLSPETVLDAVISSASALSDASAVAVYLFWDDAQSTLALVRSAGLSANFSLDPPDPILMTRHRQNNFTNTPVIVFDVNTDPHASYLRQAMAREGKAAWIELPLSVGGVGLGAIILYFDAPRSVPDELVELLRAFANQVAQAIHNARLYAITDETLEKRVGQLLALAAIGHELTATIDTATICNLVLSHALDAASAGVGAVLLNDTENGDFRIIVQSGYPDEIIHSPRVLAQGLVPQVRLSGQSILTNDVLSENKLIPILPTARAQLCVPILRSGATLGAIMLESESPGSFSDDDTHFVIQLANQAVIALDNATLFQRIAEARDRLAVILNAMSEAIVLIEKSGTVALANPRVDLIGLSPDQLIGRTLEALIEDPQLDIAERMGFVSDQDVRKLLKEARAESGWQGRDPVAYSVPNAQRYVQRHVVRVHGDDDKTIGILLVFYDQTEEHALALAREDFSNMLIHDLRGPLNAVRTGLQVMTKIIPGESAYKPMLDTTIDTSQRAIRKLLARVDSLLDVGRMESGLIRLERSEVALASIVEGVRAELQPISDEQRIRLLTRLPDDLPLLHLDADKIERVLLNLLDNALKFSPSDSAVVVAARLTTTQTLDAGSDGTTNGANGDHAAAVRQSVVRVEVIDNGPGVPNEDKVRLFDRYAQVEGRSGKRRGFGLGLTFCRLVVESHGGRIWIEDNPQGGSIFIFTLPVVSASAEV